LIVWLHGEGNDERQLRKIMPLVSMRNYVAAGPRGTQAAESGKGFSWSHDSAGLERAEDAVMHAIDAASLRYHVSRRRVFIAGYGAGGTMALRLGLAFPERFAGIASLGGHLPLGDAPLRKLLSVRKLPLLVMAGREGENYPEQQICDDLRLLHSAGMSINLRLYPCGDGLDPSMLADLDRWVMEQITAPASDRNPSGSHACEN
jgi:phospholipase/carboxylesterase